MRPLPSLLVAALLAGCAAPRRPAPLPPVVHVPSEALECPEAAQVPPPPKVPRTTEAIAGWGRRASLAAAKNASALQMCDERRQTLLDQLLHLRDDLLTVP